MKISKAGNSNTSIHLIDIFDVFLSTISAYTMSIFRKTWWKKNQQRYCNTAQQKAKRTFQRIKEWSKEFLNNDTNEPRRQRIRRTPAVTFFEHIRSISWNRSHKTYAKQGIQYLQILLYCFNKHYVYSNQYKPIIYSDRTTCRIGSFYRRKRSIQRSM